MIIKTIKAKSKYKKIIHIEKINPFLNICQVSKQKEYCNIEVWYTPKDKLIELGAYRKFFKRRTFELHIETMAEHIFGVLKRALEPEWLKVVIYLEDKELTPWSVTIDSDNLIT